MPRWLRKWLRGAVLLVGLPAAGIAALVAFKGLPELRFQCWCRDSGWDRDCSTCRVFDRCQYIGFQGWNMVYPRGYRGEGQCGIIHFEPLKSAQRGR